MPTVYDAIYAVTSPVLLSLLGYRYAFRRKYHESLQGMLGRRLPAPFICNGRRPTVFWVHAVSVGEVVAARAIISEIRAAYPHCRIYSSTITETGQAHARKILAGLVDEIFYYPVDLSWIVRRFLERIRPDVYIMMETELWPNFLVQCRQAGIRVIMMNGKVSERSYRLYRSGRFIFRRALTCIDAFCMQTRLDAARMRDLCGPEPEIHVTGNCKFDSAPPMLAPEQRAALAAGYGLDLGRPIVVVGSTHPGEDEAIAQAAAALRGRFPDLTWLVAPRHIERAEAVCRLFAERGLAVARATQPAGSPPTVLVLDRMGELAQAYSLATVAVVGGSFVPIGGHNLLEPAVYGVPVVYGPHMHKQPEILRFFDGAGAGVQVEGAALGATIERLLLDPDERRRLGRLAAETVELNRGSAKRHMDVLREVLARDER